MLRTALVHGNANELVENTLAKPFEEQRLQLPQGLPVGLCDPVRHTDSVSATPALDNLEFRGMPCRSSERKVSQLRYPQPHASRFAAGRTSIAIVFVQGD